VYQLPTVFNTLPCFAILIMAVLGVKAEFVSNTLPC
jgi:hypothetical protein